MNQSTIPTNAVLPLFSSLWLSPWKSVYVWLSTLRREMTFCHWNMQMENSYFYAQLNKGKWTCGREESRLSRNTYYDAAKLLFPTNEVLHQNDFITLVPLNVWDEWQRYMDSKQLSSRTRSNWTWVYFYLYHRINAAGLSWSHPVKKIAWELHVNDGDLCKWLETWESDGWLVRGVWDFNLGLARSYQVPNNWRTEIRQIKDEDVIDAPENI